MKFKSILQLSFLLLCFVFASSFTSTPITAKTATLVQKNKKRNFAEYLSHFEKVGLPYKLDLEDLDAHKVKKAFTRNSKIAKRKIGANKYVEFIPELNSSMFSRFPPPTIRPIARFYLDEKTLAVIYRSDSSMSEFIYAYQMVVYDLHGNIKSEHLSSFSKLSVQRPFGLIQNHPTHASDFSIDVNGLIKINNYDVFWEKDIHEHGYQNNAIVDYTFKENLFYQVNEAGIVEQINEAAINGRASID